MIFYKVTYELNQTINEPIQMKMDVSFQIIKNMRVNFINSTFYVFSKKQRSPFPRNFPKGK